MYHEHAFLFKYPSPIFTYYFGISFTTIEYKYLFSSVWRAVFILLNMSYLNASFKWDTEGPYLVSSPICHFSELMRIIIIFNSDNSYLKCNWFILSALLKLWSSVHLFNLKGGKKNDGRYLYLHKKFANEALTFCKTHQKVILNY